MYPRTFAQTTGSAFANDSFDPINYLKAEARFQLAAALGLAECESQKLTPGDVNMIKHCIQKIVELQNPKSREEASIIALQTMKDIRTSPEQLKGLEIIAKDPNYKRQAEAHRGLNRILTIATPKARKSEYKGWLISVVAPRFFMGTASSISQNAGAPTAQIH